MGPKTVIIKGDNVSGEGFRTAITIGCILGAIYIHYSGTLPFAMGAVIWLVLAMGAGFMRPTGWLLLTAPIPWLAGVGGGVLIGRYDSLGEGWLLPFAVSTLAGVIGIIFGAAARRGRSGHSVDDLD